MRELYLGEIEDWYNDSLIEEKETMLGKKAFGWFNLDLEFHELDKKSQEKIKRIFEIELPGDKENEKELAKVGSKK